MVKEVLRAVNSGKARVFLFRTIETGNPDLGTLLPYLMADSDSDTSDEEDEMADSNLTNNTTIQSFENKPLQDLSGRILIF